MISLAREGFGRDKGSGEKRKDYHKSIQTDEPTATTLIANTSVGKNNCTFCDRSHPSQDCQKIAEMSYEDRKSRVIQKRCCLVCLKSGHMAKRCHSNVRCLVFKRRHYTILCPDLRKGINSSSKDKIAGDEQKATEILFTNRPSEREIYLKTITIRLRNRDKEVCVRALMDDGSQRSYIEKSLAEELKLSPTGSEVFSQGLFGGGTSPASEHKRYIVTVESLNRKYTTSISLLDQAKICSELPRIQDRSLLADLASRGIEITDVGKDTPPIRVLLGADVLVRILTGKIEVLRSGVSAIELLATCAFLRCEYRGQVTVKLIAAKARLAPMQKPTIPRLELLGAALRARLANTFVGNRVKEIRELTNIDDWKHVPGEVYPADFATRFCDWADLLQSQWWEGPSWLYEEAKSWPLSEISVPDEAFLERRKTVITNLAAENEEKFGQRFLYFSSYTRILRMTAYVLRYEWPSDIREKYKDTIQFFVENEILKVQTRLILSQDPEDFTYPIVLPDHPLLERLILHTHKSLMHAGVLTTLAQLRERFGELNVNTEPASLPPDRVNRVSAFQITGADLAGPLFLRGGNKAFHVCSISSSPPGANDPNELKPLTPAHFIQDSKERETFDLDLIDSQHFLKRVRYLHSLRLNLRKRFYREYLGELVRSHKTASKRKAITPGEIVLVESQNPNRMNWPLARVIELFPGKDNVQRVAKLRVASGEIIRPLQRIYPLELSSIDNMNEDYQETRTKPDHEPSIAHILEELKTPEPKLGNADIQEEARTTRCGRRIVPVKRMNL
ncbi:uncharacterized protein [Parasteatoda tepidariorum]|uniref:uncharacterized protein n=1 Tax=Parasteatoda tepidariorum TaxID=114398 RepID=UPI0039BC71F4